MYFSEMVSEVRDKIKDVSPTVLVRVPEFINQALVQATEDVDIPSLKNIYSVKTVLGQAYLNMPTGFSGKLRYVGTARGQIRLLDGGIEELIQMYPDLTVTGSVESVVIEGFVLWYMRIPEEETSLICIGFDYPDELVNDNDSPTCIPDYLHRDILVNKAVSIAYEEIEESMEGSNLGPNSARFDGMYQRGLIGLRAWISKRKGTVGRSAWIV
jgi:hypothetical protein